jgi:LPS export ABC transporter protein LptC
MGRNPVSQFLRFFSFVNGDVPKTSILGNAALDLHIFPKPTGFWRMFKGLAIAASFFSLWGCSFDYGMPTLEGEYPDLVMQDTEYVRVREGDPVARIKAKQVKRYDTRQIMELENFSFEQFEDHGETINAVGNAGTATVDLNSGDISLGGKVTISVDSEDIIIETDAITWKDKERALSCQEGVAVDIYRSDGTSFTGNGFSADLRRRTWTFSGDVEGLYVHDDEKDGETTGLRDMLSEESP